MIQTNKKNSVLFQTLHIQSLRSRKKPIQSFLSSLPSFLSLSPSLPLPLRLSTFLSPSTYLPLSLTVSPSFSIPPPLSPSLSLYFYLPLSLSCAFASTRAQAQSTFCSLFKAALHTLMLIQAWFLSHPLSVTVSLFSPSTWTQYMLDTLKKKKCP